MGKKDAELKRQTEKPSENSLAESAKLTADGCTFYATKWHTDRKDLAAERGSKPGQYVPELEIQAASFIFQECVNAGGIDNFVAHGLAGNANARPNKKEPPHK